MKTTISFAFALTVLFAMNDAAARVVIQKAPPPHVWKEFVKVDGQPEPIPAEWVSTPEGKLAHSIKIPNPVPADSGYRSSMSSDEYFKLLCEREAGEFIFKTVENVEGFYFMRPLKRPTDDDLKDRYKLEAPGIERLFQSIIDRPEDRAALFVSPPWKNYQFIEEPNGKSFSRASGYRANESPMKANLIDAIISDYGLIWRGLIRPQDRQHGISGSEWIVIDLKTKGVLGVSRAFGRTGKTPNAPKGIWWLNAGECPSPERAWTLGGLRLKLYEFPAKVIKPLQGEKQ